MINRDACVYFVFSPAHSVVSSQLLLYVIITRYNFSCCVQAICDDSHSVCPCPTSTILKLKKTCFFQKIEGTRARGRRVSTTLSSFYPFTTLLYPQQGGPPPSMWSIRQVDYSQQPSWSKCSAQPEVYSSVPRERIWSAFKYHTTIHTAV